MTVKHRAYLRRLTERRDRYAAWITTLSEGEQKQQARRSLLALSLHLVKATRS